MTLYDLRRVKLRSGEQLEDAAIVDVEPFELAGQVYAAEPSRAEARLQVTRATSGLVFRLRLETRLVGPCFRCLAEVSVAVAIDATEYEAARRDEAGVEDLHTPYLADGRLDLTAWTRDEIALALPEQILCRVDCAGICPECGRDLNREPHEHAGEEIDPRWADLARLRDRL